MEDSRQKAFQKLRPPCIELSSAVLRFRGQQASIKSILQALEALHAVIAELGRLDALDEKLAEYAFFPLSNVFNESQRLSSRCLELAVQCLQVLVSRGWRQKMQPDMGKQLLILLGLLAGGSPARKRNDPPSEELICACCECMSILFICLGQIEQHLFDETGAKTIVDQNVYLLLEAITDNPSDNVQVSAAHALQTLLSQISSRVLLASLLPRTVSALTKALTPTTQIRRTHKALVAFLELLTYILPAVLGDEVALRGITSQATEGDISSRIPGIGEVSTTLDDKWLKATASQVKIALANVVKLRSHERPEVQYALFEMCLMICENCSETLSDSLQLIIGTMVMLANHDGASSSDPKKQRLRQLVLSDSRFADSMRTSLDAWIHALPRLMQGSDDRPKVQVLRQISTAFQILSEAGDASEVLDDLLAASLIESVSRAVDVSQPRSVQRISVAPSAADIVRSQEQSHVLSFKPIMLDEKSQSDSLVELNALISQIKASAASEQLTRSIMTRVVQLSGSQQLSALWLSLNLLRKDKLSLSMSDLIDLPDESFDTTPYLISDLYSMTLPLLLDSSMVSSSHDWRTSALVLEAAILQANQLGRSYRPELIDTLYPILSLLGSPEPRLRSHAMTALNHLAIACEYPNTSTMLVENVDYLINSIALKFNTFDISPQGPQVLLMLLRLCGATLVPYLDDLIGSIFAALDNFHGYPRLVELLFEVLGVVVDEAAKNPVLTITNGMEEPKHRKTAYRPSTMEDILQDIRTHKERKERRQAETDDTPLATPHRPWTSRLDNPQMPESKHESHTSDLDDANDTASNPTSQEQKEPVLSKPHTLLLSIARSTIPHLSSPSPRVRLTLLQLLTQITPILSRHENSFLPLVNDIWPAIVSRLFSAENRGTSARSGAAEWEEEQEDPAYVTMAAADAAAKICIGAGDFMSGRIQDIFPRLERLYSRVWSEVGQHRTRMGQHRGGGAGPLRKSASSRNDDADTMSLPSSAGANLRGTVDLRITQPSPPVKSTSPSSSMDLSTSRPATEPPKTSSPQHATLRTSTTQIHTSLVHLLTTILAYTSIPPVSAIGDSILNLLSPLMDDPGREEVLEALEEWNADAVWVVRERRRYIQERAKDGNSGARILEREGRWEKPPPVKARNGKVWEFADVVF